MFKVVNGACPEILAVFVFDAGFDMVAPRGQVELEMGGEPPENIERLAVIGIISGVFAG